MSIASPRLHCRPLHRASCIALLVILRYHGFVLGAYCFFLIIPISKSILSRTLRNNYYENFISSIIANDRIKLNQLCIDLD